MAAENQLQRWLKVLVLVPEMIDGRRITDAAMLEVVVMIYAGKSIKISWHNYKLTKPMPWDSLEQTAI
jgi:hypothetical protein